MQIEKISFNNIRLSSGKYFEDANNAEKTDYHTQSEFANIHHLSFMSDLNTQQIMQKRFVDKIIEDLNLGKILPNYLKSLYKKCKLNKQDITNIAIKAAGKISDSDLAFFIDEKIPLTELDTPDIISRRKCNSHVLQVTESDEFYLNNKKKLVQKELARLKTIPHDKKMIIITGLSAAGKSTYIEYLDKENYYIADIDDIKKMFPEYEKRKKDNSVHNISRIILQNEIIPEVIKRKQNIIIPTTGLSEYIERLSSPAKQNGYYVKVVHIKIDKLVAMQRAIDRYYQEGRFVDPYFIALRAPYLDNQLEDFLDSDLVDKIDIIDFNRIPQIFTKEDIENNTTSFK